VKPIRLSGHARDQIARRGVQYDEVLFAIRNAPWQPANQGRMECSFDFSYAGVWNNNYYHTKRVRPVFVEEGNQIVVVTVYSYFF
jgi:hypothetical protein